MKVYMCDSNGEVISQDNCTQEFALSAAMYAAKSVKAKLDQKGENNEVVFILSQNLNMYMVQETKVEVTDGENGGNRALPTFEMHTLTFNSVDKIYELDAVHEPIRLPVSMYKELRDSVSYFAAGLVRFLRKMAETAIGLLYCDNDTRVSVAFHDGQIYLNAVPFVIISFDEDDDNGFD